MSILFRKKKLIEFGINAECERVEKLNELIKEIYYTWISTTHKD